MGSWVAVEPNGTGLPSRLHSVGLGAELPSPRMLVRIAVTAPYKHIARNRMMQKDIKSYSLMFLPQLIPSSTLSSLNLTFNVESKNNSTYEKCFKRAIALFTS